MAYDVTVLLEGVGRLARDGSGERLPMRLRLHPAGRIAARDRAWIEAAARRGLIEISRGTLREDLSGARLVVGANSTVLQEAMLLGVPALSLRHRNYVHPSILPEDRTAFAHELSWQCVMAQMEHRPDEECVRRFRINMGLESPALTTTLLLSEIWAGREAVAGARIG
jgi:hypothetical protein